MSLERKGNTLRPPDYYLTIWTISLYIFLFQKRKLSVRFLHTATFLPTWIDSDRLKNRHGKNAEEWSWAGNAAVGGCRQDEEINNENWNGGAVLLKALYCIHGLVLSAVYFALCQDCDSRLFCDIFTVTVEHYPQTRTEKLTERCLLSFQPVGFVYRSFLIEWWVVGCSLEKFFISL